MGRTVQTIQAAGNGPALTQAQILALIQANTGYEYIKTVKLNTTEVAGFDITGLDTTIYSGFRIVSNRLSYGGSAAASTWTLRVITGSSTVDSAGNYEIQGIRFQGPVTFNTASTTGWSTNFGYGGPPASADFMLDYGISPNAASVDANIWLQVTDSKQGGYWPASGIMSGIHTPVSGAPPTGIQILTSQNFRAMQDNAYVIVMGLRIKA